MPRKLFNNRGESVSFGWHSMIPSRIAPQILGVSIRTEVLGDCIKQNGMLIESELVIPAEQVGAVICLLAQAAGLAVEIKGVDSNVLRSERLRQERGRTIVRRLHMKPDEHDLYATGDDDAPRVIQDGNGEVVLALCRKCGRGESQLDDFLKCDQPASPETIKMIPNHGLYRLGSGDGQPPGLDDS